MKTFLIMIINIILLMVYSSNACGQKIMKLDNELKANSKPMEAKRNGISSAGKYQFGPYSIVSGKAGWISTTSTQKFFSFETKSESKSKSSFVFVANDKDTILVSTSTNSKASETDFGDGPWLNQNTDNYIALISPLADTTVWKMIVVCRSGGEVKGNFKAEGTLTNGVTNIQIREVKQWEDGKNPAFKMICGYEFFIDNKPVAAVQSNNISQKKFVWLLQNLNDRMKSILAAASASLMIYTDYADVDKGD